MSLAKPMELNKHGFLQMGRDTAESDDPMADLLQAQVDGLTEAVDDVISQAKKVNRDVRDVKSRRERLRAIAERGGYKVRRLAKEYRGKLLHDHVESEATSASQVTLSVFDHNAVRAEQVVTAHSKVAR